MNTRTKTPKDDARLLVTGGILLLENFDQDDLTLHDRVEAANDYLNREDGESTQPAGQH